MNQDEVSQGNAGRAPSQNESSGLVEWVDSHVSRAAKFIDNRKMLKFGALAANKTGLFCEFGVAKGASLHFLAGIRPDVTWYGFDTFTGLPESSGYGLRWTKGMFDCGGKPPELDVDNVEYHVGLFQDTICPFSKVHPGPISFLHIDSDLFKSAWTVLSFLYSQIVPGTLILFDEFWGFPGWEEAGMSEAEALYNWCRWGPSRYVGEYPPRKVQCVGVHEKNEKALFRVTN